MDALMKASTRDVGVGLYPHTFPRCLARWTRARGKDSPKKSPGNDHVVEEVEPPPLSKAKNEPLEDQSHAIGEKNHMDKMYQAMKHAAKKGATAPLWASMQN